MKKEQLISQLNHGNSVVRLDALKELMQMIRAAEIETPKQGNDVNIHTHTNYSFSPYSPTKAVWMAYAAGLKSVGIMDHDSINGAREFLEAGKIVGILTTIGVECRLSMESTSLRDKVINASDQKGMAYCTIHGVPHQCIDEVLAFFEPYIEHRIVRNRKMVCRMNERMVPYGISLDFEKDIVASSKYMNGGTITERHLLYALAKKIVRKYGVGEGTVCFLENELNVQMNDKTRTILKDRQNPFYEYDLLGVLKSSVMKEVYIPATDECPDVKEVMNFANRIHACPCYVYSGGAEDAYLEELFEIIKDAGFKALSYMPSKITAEQLKRVRALCEKYGLIQLTGEDINSPKQSFICEAQRRPEFSVLYDTAMDLIRHEHINSIDMA